MTTQSPTQRDFIELQTDVSHSPLWNRDLAPTTIRERTWSTWNIAALWIGMSVVITTYTLAGGFIEAGMNWWQAMITILLGNTIVLIPMILNAHAGTKYGVSFPVLSRAAFGTKGANVPAMLRAIVACGWFGIQTWIGGTALDALFGYMFPAWNSLSAIFLGVALHTWLAFLLFWAIQVVIILKGVEGIKYLETWSAPLLLAGGLILLVWAAWRAGGLGRVLTESAALQKQQNEFWTIFPGALTASVGYWATLSLNIPDFTRYARSQKSQMLGQALGLPLTMTAFAFIGVAVTSATLLIYGVAIPNPVDLMARFDNVLIILFATAVIFAAQLTTNMAANVVSPSNDFSNLNPRLISYVTGGLITAVIGILMMPWKLMESMGAYIFTWLIGYSGLMGAIAGILICDYWVIRKQQLNLAGLFDPHGPYSYGNGFNWRAMVALVAAIAPVVPGFLRAASTPGGQVSNPAFLDHLYTYSWFVTFALGFVIYYVLTKARRESLNATHG
ncbi:MAG TPA: NCS1 family nucleobase:cation symporter-1 [Pyrinomonadaceae bacterium]|jgi:NCS1 family nucleobase:cation symporter-1|nr:NCS1 family nucleobase:cation symporter-1 [Pyrinomonadaceae bacterium]